MQSTNNAAAAAADDDDDDDDAVIRSGDKYMFDELSEDEMETTSSSEVLGEGGHEVSAPGPVAPDWREEKIGVGPVEVCLESIH